MRIPLDKIMSCSTWTMARTPAAFAAETRTSIIACLSPVETPLVGSSSRITLGLSAKALRYPPILFALRQRRSYRFKPGAQAQNFRDTLGVGLQCVIALQRAERIADAAQAGRDRHRQGFAHGECWKDVDQLKCARHSESGEFHRPDAGDVADPESESVRPSVAADRSRR